jgi:hypothetical protein
MRITGGRFTRVAGLPRKYVRGRPLLQSSDDIGISNSGTSMSATTSADRSHPRTSFDKVKLLSLIQDKFVDLYHQIYVYQLRLIAYFRYHKSVRHLERLKDSLGEESWSTSLEDLKTASYDLDLDLKNLANGKISEIGSKIDEFSKKAQEVLEELRNQTCLMTEQ